MSQNESKITTDERIAAAKKLQADAEAAHEQLIKELSDKRAKLQQEVKQLDDQISELAMNLDRMRGVLIDDEPVKEYVGIKHHVSDERILGFIISEGGTQTTGDVQAFFQFSSATVVRRLNSLLAANKVTMEKKGPMKLWTVVK